MIDYDPMPSRRLISGFLLVLLLLAWLAIVSIGERLKARAELSGVTAALSQLAGRGARTL